jgi:hypothetical protein
MSDSGIYIYANLIKIGQEEIKLDSSKALSLSSNSIYTDSGIKFSIPSNGSLSFNGKGINTQNKNKSNQNLTVFPNKSNIGKNKDITVSIPNGISVSGILPDPPTNIIAQRKGSTQIEVTFTDPEFTGGSSILNYTAFVSYDDQNTSSSNTFPQTYTSSKSPITVSGLTLGNTYKIKVYSTNSTGNSEPSLESNSVLSAIVPSAPSLVTAKAGPGVGEITLNWSQVGVGNNGGSTVTEYKIYYHQDGLDKTETTTGTNYKVTGLENGTSYIFIVKAYNEVGEGSGKESSPAETFSVPLKPVSLSSEPQVKAVLLKWVSPSNDGGTPIRNYKIYDSSGTVIATPLSTDTEYKVSELLDETSYTFSIAAVNDVGIGFKEYFSLAKTPTKPSAPRGLTLVQGLSKDEVELSWTVPEFTGGSQITEYNIYKDGTLLATVPADKTTYKDSGIILFTSYNYNLEAVNAVGIGTRSALYMYVIYN